MVHSDCEFTSRTEILDGNQYYGCTFRQCTLVYRGGQIPTMKGCRFLACSWALDDAANRTMGFLHSLYHGNGDGGRQLVEGTLDALRENPVAAAPMN